jgi:hypothetical protein
MTPPTDRKWRWHAAVFAIYAVISFAVLDHGVSITANIAGAGGDPLGSIWFLAWWPWAIAHHLNPLYSHLIWQPLGVAMMWVTSTPLLALLAAPVTLLEGPVLAYNLLILAAPVLSAFAAYCLCFRVTESRAAALIGGYLFGFSAYEMATDLATLNLSVTLIVPCLVLLALTRLDGDINRLRCVFLASFMMVCAFLISIEIFATMIVFGFIAWALAYGMLPAKRDGLRRLLFDTLIAAPIVLAVLSPFLLAMLADAHFVLHPAAWPAFFVADLANFVLPSPVTAIGGNVYDRLDHPYATVLQEQDAYLGLPLIVILLLFAKDHWRTTAGRFLGVLLLVLVVASLGPVLWLAGSPTRIILPWFLVLKLPLISAALPDRFALYVSLVAALIAAIWIAEAAGRQRVWRFALGCLACIFLIPAPHLWTTIPSAVFFQPGRVQSALGANPRLLVLPFGGHGPSTYWQVENNFGYQQAGGYLGFPPAAMQQYAAVMPLFSATQGPHFLNDFEKFCIGTKTQYVVAGPGTPQALSAVLAQLHWTAQKIDDVTVFTVPKTNNQDMTHG